MGEIRSLAFLVAALAGIAPGALPAHAAAPLHPEQAEPSTPAALLVEATLEVDVESPIRARVVANLRVEGEGAFDLLWTPFPGQRLTEVEARLVGGAQIILPATGRIRRATIGGAPGPRRIRIAYTVETGDEQRFRFPLPVPEIPSDAAEAPVRLTVRLPRDSPFHGDAFPRLERQGAGDPGVLGAELVSVPAFVHVVFGDDAGRIGRHRWIEALALGLALLAVFGLVRQARGGGLP